VPGNPKIEGTIVDPFRIRRCRKMTSKPFGVNITLLPTITPPDYVGYARVIVEEGINIVETAGNNPRPVIEVFRNAPYKVYILHKYLPQ
jgi:NADH:quinone reductase (non-electrogenic)